MSITAATFSRNHIKSRPLKEAHREIRMTQVMKQSLVWAATALLVAISPVKAPAHPGNDLQALIKQAEEGNAAAQQELGVLYATGEGGAPQSLEEAKKWWSRAAEQGRAGARYNLGLMYDNGTGVAENPAEALRLYRLAAEQGLADAQNALGKMYEMGRGIGQDVAEARKWYRRAAWQGYIFAQSNLGFQIYAGAKSPDDHIEAYAWISLAAGQGNAIARAHLAELTEKMSQDQISSGKRLAGEIQQKIQSSMVPR